MENILKIDDCDEDFSFESIYGMPDEDLRFEIEIAFALHKDNQKYFIKLLSPNFFIDIPIYDRLTKAIFAIISNEEMKTKYLQIFIVDLNIEITILKSIYNKYYDYLKDQKNYIEQLFILRDLQKELPMNNTKEEKKRTKV
jgi:hypothetical protein